MAGLSALRRTLTTRLLHAGIDEAEEEVRRLILALEGMSASRLITDPDYELDADNLARLECWIKRREAREPLSQILGCQAFWTLDLKVTRDVLTPRADSEALIEAALKRRPDRVPAYRFLDLGTGSGALILALLSEYPKATGVGVDLSPEALAVARENMRLTGLEARCEMRQGCWADGLSGPFDLIISNPPYIAHEVIASLDPEVRDFEPHLALDGGADGLDPYPHLFREARRLLAPKGVGVYEIGYDQGARAQEIAHQAGFQDVEIVKDLGGRDRAIAFSQAH
ncbi:peptide chain release factor N(5)-glutamine methyltransferase [Woodsholea maritima]|uniref:peptide chain release factor N(5)-glutamine methyltransferase n=1 Tax=Woodsholea maritima TaxID=240237 RepID=UPI0003640565|nr:peptide chain release factor N(5)-glutamine methyltransferase [Woodsholea maritima]